MPKPLVNQILPFDSDFDHVLSFSWSGDQSYRNRCILYDAETMAVVYDRTVSAFTLTHTVPAHTLTNGKQWVIQFQSFDREGIASPLSDKAAFYTFARPDFYFSGLPDNGEISNASYTVNVTYRQSDFEELASCRFYLYDSAKTLLLESQTLYDTDPLSYTFRGLDNHTQYLIRCKGVTVNRMEADTGYAKIYVKYENPSVYGRIYAENEKRSGYIKFHTNIVVIRDKDGPVYEYDNGMIDLTGRELWYGSGFCIDGNFTGMLRGLRLWQTGTILEAWNDSLRLRISSRIYPDGRLRFKLEVPNAPGAYLLYSEPLTFTDEDMITLWFRRIHDVYGLQVFVNDAFSTDTDVWFGEMLPKGIEKYELWITDGEAQSREMKAAELEVVDSSLEPVAIKEDNIWIGD